MLLKWTTLTSQATLLRYEQLFKMFSQLWRKDKCVYHPPVIAPYLSSEEPQKKVPKMLFLSQHLLI